MQRCDRSGAMSNLVWQPGARRIEDSDLVSSIEAMTYSGYAPLAEQSLALLADISRTILQSKVARQAPQYTALAYWLRPAALARLATELVSNDHPNQLRVRRGVALHLPPANVDTIFVYSWAMSVLAGNANVVRLSESLDDNTAWLVSTVAETVAKHGQSHCQLFCHYPYNSQIERQISLHCDLRMIWGGDAKVTAASATAIRPDGLSIGFPDRKSFAIIKTVAYAEADDTIRNALAERFYNDVYWFDQMGCGSPRLLAWLGKADNLAEDFYLRLAATIDRRAYTIETGAVIKKFGAASDLLAEAKASNRRSYGNALHICQVTDPTAIYDLKQGGGFLCDWTCDSLDAVAEMVGRSVQTIVHYGLTADEQRALAHGISGRGGYRIVPVGQALQFGPVWDGLDLFGHMTRQIVISV